MSEKIYKYGTIVLGAALVILIIAYVFKGCGKECPEITTTTEVDSTPAVDSVPYEKPEPEQVIKWKEKPVYETIYTETNEVFWQQMYEELSKDYEALWIKHHAINKYKLVLRDDTSIFAQYEPTVTQNELQAKGLFTSFNRRPTAQNVYANARGRIGIGFGANYYWGQNAPQNRMGVEVQAQYISKSWWGAELNCDPFNQYAGAKMLIMFGKANRKTK